MTRLLEHPALEQGSLLHVLHLRASTQPDKRVFDFRTHLADGVDHVHLSFSALERRAHAVGTRLQELGLEGERAILLYPPGLEFISAFLGCLSAGVIAVPTPLPRPNRPMERLRAILADAQPGVVLTTSATAAEPSQYTAHSPELALIPWLASDAIDDKLGLAWCDPGVGHATVAFLQYTSGSTDEPKGVMVTHGNLLHNLEAIGVSFGATSESRGVFWLPLHHDMGLIGGVLQTIYCGGTSLLFSPVSFLQEPIRWLEAISQTHATISGAPNFAYDLCARKATAEDVARLDLSRWSVAFNGAEPVRSETLDRFVETFAPCGFRREAFLPCYGMAEATLLVSGRSESVPPVILTVDAAALEENRVSPSRNGGARARTLVGCGHSIESQEIAIVDPETGRRCADDRVGEIWVAGPSIAQGYWNRVNETAATFRATQLESWFGPFLRTGDLGFEKDGELFVTGRLKDVIIIRGRNLYPQDLELTAARSHALLRTDGCAAFSVDVDGAECLVVASEVERGAIRVQTDEIITAIRQAIAVEHEIEVDAVLLLKPAGIPKTTSGKIRRSACRAGYLAGTFDVLAASDRLKPARAPRPVEPTGPSHVVNSPPASNARRANEIEAWLAARVATMLGVDPSAIDVCRPLSQLGLGSLRTIELAADVQKWLGRPVAATLFYRDATLVEHAAELAEHPDIQCVSAAPAPGSQRAGKHPLSHGQQSLWSLNQINPTSAAHNIAGAVRIRGVIDALALRSAFQELSDRHAALRARFPEANGHPLQQIDSAVGVDFRVEDASDLSEAELSRRIASEARRPFDLVNGPVFRARLFSHKNGDPILLLAMHHIVSDFWSVAILIDELGRIYPALCSGRPVDLAAPTRQSTDFARWQSARLAGADGERLWEYWRSQLAGPLPVLDLPTDRPRPSVQTDRGATRSLQLDRQLTRRLVALGGEHGSSLYVTLLAAFQVLLHRYTGQDDVIVGSPVTGRSQPDFAGVVGFLVNTLPLRSNLSTNPPFAAFLSRVRQTVWEGLEHQDFPFALMVERLGLARDPSRTPVFQAMFVFQQAQVLDSQGLSPFALHDAGSRMQLGGLAIESMALDLGTAQFDLTLVAAEREDRLALSLEYNVDLFDAATIERLLEHFQTLLESIVAAPELPVGSIGLLPAAERRRLLSAWGTCLSEPPPAEVITQLFDAQVQRNPDATAVILDDHQVPYAELDERANRLARRLRKVGVVPDARVGLCVERSTEMIVGILGVLKAGGAYVPLDPDSPAERLELLLADAGIEVLLTQVHLRDWFTSRVNRVICLDTIARPATTGESLDAGIAARPDPPISGENLAYVSYTSGSTGTPKGVMVTHRNLVHSTHARLQYYDDPMPRFLLLSSIAFDSSVAGIFGTLCQGGTLVLPPPGAERDPVVLGRLIEDARVSHLLCVPSLYEVLLAEVAPREIEGLRVAIVAGEPCRKALVKRHYTALPHTELINEYGPTETTVWCSAHRCRPDEERLLVPIGKPVPHARLYVLDSRGEPAPIGVIGELYAGGPGVARGYLNRPALTAERFVPDPFDDAAHARLYRTGDLARWLDDGTLEFRGRIDDQVKVRGHRIELGEVESALERHPAVREAAVVAREDAQGVVRLAAYLVADVEPASIADRAEWRRWARSLLPEAMVPTAFVVIDRLPRLPNGKVDRKALPAPDPYQSAPRGKSLDPRNPVEERLAHIAAGVLGCDRLGVHDDLFDLGLDSILAIQIATQARQSGLDLSPAQLFEHTTIAELAQNAGTCSDPTAQPQCAAPAEAHNVDPRGTHTNGCERVNESARPIDVDRRARNRGLDLTPDLLVGFHSVAGIAAPRRSAERTPLEAAGAVALARPAIVPSVMRYDNQEPPAATPPPYQPDAPARELLGWERVYRSVALQSVDAKVPGERTTRVTDRPARSPARLITPLSAPTVIESFGVYLPPKVVSTAEVVRGCRLPLDFPLERMTGIRDRRMAGDTEFAIDLAEKAVLECLARSAYQPKDIDLLICCNISRCDGPGMQFTYEPATAARLQRRFGLDHAIAFDISNACAGTFTAITIADAFFKTGAARRALIVSGEYITHLTRTAQKEITNFLDPRIACLTLGDSGVAIVLERGRAAGVGFQELDLYSLGKYSNLCVAKATDRSHGGAIMLTDSIQGASVAIQQVAGHSLRALDRRGWPADSLDQIIMHQTSETTLDGAMAQINRSLRRTVCDRRNTFYDLAERGNTATNSHFVALRDAIDAGLIRPGSRVLFGISGSGQTVGTALYTFDDLPERIRSPRKNYAPTSLNAPSPQWGEGARRAGEGAAIEPSRPANSDRLLESRLQAVPGPGKAGTPTCAPLGATPPSPPLSLWERSPQDVGGEGKGAGARTTGEGAVADANQARPAVERSNGHRQAELPSDQPEVVTPRVRIESLGTMIHDPAQPRDSLALVRQAAEHCLSASRYRREEIGLIIHSGVYRNDFLSEPAVAAIAAGALQINEDCNSADAPARQTLAFDVMNSGVGSLNACHVATQMIRAGKAERALVIAAEIENNADLGPEHHVGLMEMGSALLLDSTTGPEGFGQFVFRSFPAHGDDVTAHTVVREGAATLDYQQSPAYERHLIEGIQSTTAELLSLEGLAIDAVARVFPPHRSTSFVSELARALGLPLDRFVVLPDQNRDYRTSSLAATLESAQADGQVRPGDIGLLIAAGAGVQIGCATYRFGHLP
jgi:amino acid adenylation domain-containing protein